MSFSVSPAANFPELEPDDFCPKLSTPCFVLFPDDDDDDDDDIFDEICKKSEERFSKSIQRFCDLFSVVDECRVKLSFLSIVYFWLNIFAPVKYMVRSLRSPCGPHAVPKLLY